MLLKTYYNEKEYKLFTNYNQCTNIYSLYTVVMAGSSFLSLIFGESFHRCCGGKDYQEGLGYSIRTNDGGGGGCWGVVGGSGYFGICLGNFRGDRDYSQMDLGQCDRVWWEYGGVVRGTLG